MVMGGKRESEEMGGNRCVEWMPSISNSWIRHWSHSHRIFKLMRIRIHEVVLSVYMARAAVISGSMLRGLN